MIKPDTLPVVAPLSLTERFDAAGATVPKSERYFNGSPNQDSLDRFEHPSGNMLVAAVFDGCGSQPHSHIGAHLGGRLLLRLIYEEVERKVLEQKQSLATVDFKSVQQVWGAEIEKICRLTCGDDWATDMESRFEFTIVAVVITPQETMVLHAGDGYFAINGKTTKLEASNNAPGYPIYPFLPGIDTSVQEHCWITTEPIIKTDVIKSIVLATDGAEFLAQGLDFMTGYQTSASLQNALASLQTPRLVSTYTSPTLVSNPSEPQAYNSPTRTDIRTKLNLDISASFSASLQRGPLGDDLAVIVITKIGSIQRHQPDTSLSTAQSTSNSTLTRAVSGLKGLLGINQKDRRE